MEIWNYISKHAEEILAVLLAVHATAVLIANLTHTPKDNEFLARSYKWIEALAGIITRRAKR